MILMYGLLVISGIYISIYVFYCFLLVCVHFLIRDTKLPSRQPTTRFAIIIPAHNEKLLLPRLLQTIRRLKYPNFLFTPLVIADNCTDETELVASRNGACVLVRKNEQKRGKGYALQWAIKNIDLDQYDAIFIIDADSVMKEDVLLQLDADLANGERIIQCYNGVLNINESWFTHLLDISRTIGNEIYHPAKNKLGLSSYLMGNGMCFTKSILLKYGWDSFSVGEDWEFYAKVILSNEKIYFDNKARVYHQEASSLRQATSQRMRWSSGRFAIAWRYGYKMIYNGLLERTFLKIDASLPLLLPNPSLGINITIISLLLTFTLPNDSIKHKLVLLFSWLVLIQFSIFMLGLIYVKNRMWKIIFLLTAPFFMVWKMVIDILAFIGFGRKSWIRTNRES